MAVFDTKSMHARSGFTNPDFVADRHYYLTHDGRVVVAGNPDIKFLLVAKGCRLDRREAEKHNLFAVKAEVEAAEAEVEASAKAFDKAQSNKAIMNKETK